MKTSRSPGRLLLHGVGTAWVLVCACTTSPGFLREFGGGAGDVDGGFADVDGGLVDGGEGASGDGGGEYGCEATFADEPATSDCGSISVQDEPTPCGADVSGATCCCAARYSCEQSVTDMGCGYCFVPTARFGILCGPSNAELAVPNYCPSGYTCVYVASSVSSLSYNCCPPGQTCSGDALAREVCGVSTHDEDAGSPAGSDCSVAPATNAEAGPDGCFAASACGAYCVSEGYSCCADQGFEEVSCPSGYACNSVGGCTRDVAGCASSCIASGDYSDSDCETACCSHACGGAASNADCD